MVPLLGAKIAERFASTFPHVFRVCWYAAREAVPSLSKCEEDAIAKMSVTWHG